MKSALAEVTPRFVIWGHSRSPKGLIMSLPPFDFAQDKLRRESRKTEKDWIPAFAGRT